MLPPVPEMYITRTQRDVKRMIIAIVASKKQAKHTVKCHENDIELRAAVALSCSIFVAWIPDERAENAGQKNDV